MNKVTDADIKKLAIEMGINWKLIKTVLLIESAGSGYDSKTGKIKIQFEPLKYHQQLALKKISSTLKFLGGTLYDVIIGTKVIENKVDIQSKEWDAFNTAVVVNEDAAYMATSWGLGQIMGFNYKSCGYNSAKEMAEDFMKSEVNQLKGMMSFIKKQPKMFNALIAMDWATFASQYNGPKYKQFEYDTKLKTTYDSLK